MPRDATETRNRLIAEAERLFADQGIWRVRVQDIVAAAGQRNSSALSYHFGSRQGVLDAILRDHGEPIDQERGEVWAEADDDGTPALIEALIQPLTRRLSTSSGRCYLRIVAQLSAEFARWDLDPTHVPANLNAILRLLRDRTAVAIRSQRDERVLGMIQLMTASLAERARRIDAGDPLATDAEVYAANLGDMLVGVIEAPARAVRLETTADR
ncbi:MAG: TetR/AcrR family transcriptional regulator [Acidimicrobiia bacterium]|nr:TetR/AcrR family transcriptional regulator [Acidimicrobiia bacterium]MYG58010.1 TetR/AcrR family transcriptional regulator [Acidimicrobiia bacterium]MYJ33815.1 TetR/AcrR family transcriptional regulator [Acidimicrobiia bacterium]